MAKLARNSSHLNMNNSPSVLRVHTFTNNIIGMDSAQVVKCIGMGREGTGREGLENGEGAAAGVGDGPLIRPIINSQVRTSEVAHSTDTVSESSSSRARCGRRAGEVHSPTLRLHGYGYGYGEVYECSYCTVQSMSD